MLRQELKRNKIWTESVNRQGCDPLIGRFITEPLFQQQRGMMSDSSGDFDPDFEHQYEYNNDEVEESQDALASSPVKPLNSI